MADFFQLTVTQRSRTWANAHRLRRSPWGGLGWGARFSPSPLFVQVPRAPLQDRALACLTRAADMTWVRFYSSPCNTSVQFSHSVVSESVTPWTTACQASLSITTPRSPPKPMSIESVMPSNHLILCHPLLLLPSIFPSIRVFSKWVSSSHQVAKVLEFQLQHQSFQLIFRTDLL